MSGYLFGDFAGGFPCADFCVVRVLVIVTVADGGPDVFAAAGGGVGSPLVAEGGDDEQSPAVLGERAGWGLVKGRRGGGGVPDPNAEFVVAGGDEQGDGAGFGAELPEESHENTDSVARRGRAVAVDLIAATQRPTLAAMGRNTAVRSQMDVRICLRVREPRDTDLILGQGSLNSGWHAHKLTQPGEFLISDPEHGTPERNRAYLITDEGRDQHAARFGRPPATLPAPIPDTPWTAPESPQAGDTRIPRSN